jgi:hypothetical protein
MTLIKHRPKYVEESVESDVVFRLLMMFDYKGHIYPS